MLTRVDIADANIFYYLEAWEGSTVNQYTTVYLSQMHTFQKHATTCAFKIAGGVELSGNTSLTLTRSSKQTALAPVFVQKIIKAFLDSLYAFLDGLVHLASDESSTDASAVIAEAVTSPGTSSLATIDVRNTVRIACPVLDYITYKPYDAATHKDTRLLLVVSNFDYLANTLIPSMTSELETAFNTSIEEDRKVCRTRNRCSPIGLLSRFLCGDFDDGRAGT